MAHNPQSYWESYEPRGPLETLADLLTFIASIAAGEGSIVWRGVTDASWALHSSLYRWGFDHFGEPIADTRFQRLESWTVERAREWGLDRVPSGRSGLELLAWMQHTGSPTRLIDVTHNPLVAAYFACEAQATSGPANATPEVDGRLFAIGSTAEPLVDDGRRDLPWLDPDSTNYARTREQRTLIWTPPAVDARIAAQSGAFLIGPLPNTHAGGNWYNRSTAAAADRYTAAEVRELTSLPIRAYAQLSPGEVYRRNPLISVRIAAEAKAGLRAGLETVFNLRPRLLFPDPYGLAGHLRRRRQGPHVF